MDSLVSVIIPVYNVEKYLERCVESIINQTYQKLEIILVDDGSPDRCPQICDDFALRDARIRVIHKENGGLSSARNAGIACMKGAYVTFVDSDDFLDKEAISAWKKSCEEYGADLVVGNLREYYTQEDILYMHSCTKEVVSSETMMRKMLIENQQLCAACGKLYISSIFEQLRFPEDVKFAEDMAVIHKIFQMGNIIVYDNNQYYYYNQNGISLVRSKFNPEKLKRVEAAKEWMEFVDVYYPAIHQEAFAAYMTILINECTYLLDVEEYLDRYIKEIKKNYKRIRENSYIGVKDKIKAFFLKNEFITGYKLVRRICGLD